MTAFWADLTFHLYLNIHVTQLCKAEILFCVCSEIDE